MKITARHLGNKSEIHTDDPISVSIEVMSLKFPNSDILTVFVSCKMR
jgi:hypothetical protein